jgi:acylphosphatase
MEMIAKRLCVFGKVQGVFFRESTRQLAQQLGLLGWVRNRGDSSVEVFVQGELRQIEKFIAWARNGPPTARVDELNIEDVSLDVSLTSFERR